MTTPAEVPASARATVARNAFNLVIGQAATTALAIVFSAALGRSLGARDFGLYFLISSFSTFAYVLADWGQQYYVIREVARFPERGSQLLGTALALRAAAAALVAIPTGLLTWALGYDARTCWFSVAFVFATLPFFLAQSYGMVFRGRDRMGLDAWVSVVNKLALLAVALAALALGTGLSGVVAAQAVAGLIALALAAQLYGRVTTGPLRYSAQTAREVIAGGSALVTMMAAISVQPYLDAIILSKLSPQDAVGWFGAAKNIMGTLLAPATILVAAEYPRLSRAASNVTTFSVEVRSALRLILWLGALCGVSTYLFADAAIGIIYGQEHFGPAGAILKVYGAGLFLVFIDIGAPTLGTNGGYNLALGANDRATFRSGNWIEPDPIEGAAARSELARDAEWARAARRWISGHPARWLTLAVGRALAVLDSVGRPRTAGLHDNPWAKMVGWAMLPWIVFGLAGLWIDRRLPEARIVALAFLLVLASSSATIVKPRFRFPVDPLLAIFAADFVSRLHGAILARWARAPLRA